jgi:hypothetical protein
VQDHEGHGAYDDILHMADVLDRREMELLSLTRSRRRTPPERKTEIAPLVLSTRFITACDDWQEPSSSHSRSSISWFT